jgi:hypothetical protein
LDLAYFGSPDSVDSWILEFGGFDDSDRSLLENTNLGSTALHLL